MSFLNYCRQPLCIAFSVFFGFILWIIYEADRGADNIFMNAADSVPYGDKLGHVWLYGGLALLLNLLLNRRVVLIKSMRLQLGSVLVFGFAAAEELSQGFFATRSLDGWDLLADLLGVGIAAFLVNTKKAEINMGVIAASLLILVLPVILFGLITYWLWMRGILGRICLVGVFMCGAVEAHSIIYPQKNLKENYARVIG